jgi:NCAIR mutase (PurE)-related protein
MDLKAAARVLANQALFRATGWRRAGRALVAATESTDETVRTLAGMSLVKAGVSAVPLVEEALERGYNRPTLITILADIGDATVESEIEKYVLSADPPVAKAAQRALAVLHARLEQGAHNRA